MTAPVLPKLKTYAYADIRPVAAMTKTFLVLYGIAILACVIATLLQWDLLTQAVITPEDAEANDGLMRLTTYLRIGTYILVGISVMVWTYRAHVNARSQGVFGLTSEPGIYAFSYIIPFANFVLPFQGMKELWAHCFAVTGTRKSGTPALLGCWWAAWLLSLILGVYVNKVLKAKDIPGLIYATQVILVFLACSLAAGILLWVIVSRISAHQAERQAQGGVTRAEGVAANN
jgi:hypothetical protein